MEEWRDVERRIIFQLQPEKLFGQEIKSDFSNYSRFHFILGILSEIAKLHPNEKWLENYLSYALQKNNLPESFQYFFPNNTEDEKKTYPSYNNLRWFILGIKKTIEDSNSFNYLDIAEKYLRFPDGKRLSDWVKTPGLGNVLIHLSSTDACRQIDNEKKEIMGVGVTIKVLFTKEFLISLYTEKIINKYKKQFGDNFTYLLDHKIVQDVEDMLLISKQLNLIQDDRESGHFYLTPYFSRLMQKWKDLSIPEKNYELAKAEAFSLRLPRGKIAQYGIRNLRIFASVLAFFLDKDPNNLSWVENEDSCKLLKEYVVLPTDKGGKEWPPYRILIDQGLSDEYKITSDPNETFALALHACVTYGWLKFCNSIKIKKKYILNKKDTKFRRAWALSKEGLDSLKGLNKIENFLFKKLEKKTLKEIFKNLYGYKQRGSLILDAIFKDSPYKVLEEIGIINLSDKEKSNFENSIYKIFTSNMIDEPCFSSFRNDPALKDTWIRPGFNILKGLEKFNSLTFIEISLLSHLKSENKILSCIRLLETLRTKKEYLDLYEKLIEEIHLEDYFKNSEKNIRNSAGFSGSLASGYWFPLYQYTDHLTNIGLVQRNSNKLFKLRNFFITKYGLNVIKDKPYINENNQIIGKIEDYPKDILKSSLDIYDLINQLSSHPKTHLIYRHSVEKIIKDIKQNKKLNPLIKNQINYLPWPDIAHKLYSRIKNHEIAIESTRFFIPYLIKKCDWSWSDVPKKLNATHFEIYDHSWILDVLGNHAKAAKLAYPDRFSKTKFQFPGKWSRLGLSLQKVLRDSFEVLGITHIYDKAYIKCRQSKTHTKKCRPDFIFLKWNKKDIKEDEVWGDAKWQSRTFIMSDSARYLDHCQELLIFYAKGEPLENIGERIKFVHTNTIIHMLRNTGDINKKTKILKAFRFLYKDEIPDDKDYQISKGEQAKLEEKTDSLIEKTLPLAENKEFLINL
jgi:hypothetical protein